MASINVRNFLAATPKFFAHFSWVSELLQNAYRSGATTIKVTLTPDSFIIEDDGCGISDWAKLLQISTTGWGEDVVAAQDPAGMGVFSALLAFPSVIESNGLTLVTTPDKLTNQEPLGFSSSSVTKGTRISCLSSSARSVMPPHFMGGVFIRKHFSALIYQLDGITPLHFELDIHGAPKFKGTSLELPNHEVGATFTDEPQTLMSLSDQSDSLGSRPYAQTKQIKVLPLTTDAFQVKPASCHLVDLTRRRQGHLDIFFHGQSIRMDLPFSSCGINYSVLVRGSTSPLTLKLPDRREVIKDSQWDKLIQAIKTYHDTIMEQVVSTEPAFPVLRLLGNFKDHTFQPPESIYHNDGNFNTNDMTSVILGFRQATLYAPAELQISGSLSSIPDIYHELDFIIENYLPTVQEACDDEALPLQVVPKLLEALARQGALKIGAVDRPAPLDCHTSLNHISLNVCNEDFTYKTSETAYKTTTMPEALGGHTIDLFDNLHLSYTPDEDSDLATNLPDVCEWDVTHPVVINCSDYGNTTSQGRFIANKAYGKLMHSHPREAARLFAAAVLEGYESDEGADYDYSYEAYRHDCKMDNVKRFFTQQTYEDKFQHHIRTLLSELSPALATLLANKKTKLHLKKVVWTSSLCLRAAVEGTSKVIQVAIDGDHMELQEARRKLPAKKTKAKNTKQTQ